MTVNRFMGPTFFKILNEIWTDFLRFGDVGGRGLRWSNTKNIIFLSLMLSDCSFTMLLCELP